MKSLPKDKKNKVILVCLMILMAAAGWVFTVLAWQRDHLGKAERQLAERQAQFADMTNTLARSAQIGAELAEAEARLSIVEAQMASGDIYYWAINLLRDFRADYKVDIQQVNQPVVGDHQLIPGFPYRQAAFTVSGTAFYHDLGLFIADFENRFPFARIINFEAKPGGTLGAEPSDAERLAFSMDVIFLIKPNAS